MDTVLYLFLWVLPTVTVFSLLKAIISKDDKSKFNTYAVVASVSLTALCIAVAYF